jgi:hypothetical protein
LFGLFGAVLVVVCWRSAPIGPARKDTVRSWHFAMRNKIIVTKTAAP